MSVTGQQTRRSNDSGAAGRVQPGGSGSGARKSPEQAKLSPGRSWLWFVLVLFANYLLVRFLIPSPDGPVTVPYTLFKEEAGKSNVEAIYSQGDTITGRFTAPITYPPAGQKCGAQRRVPTSERARGDPPRRAQNGEYLHDDGALLRRPRFGSIFNRKQSGDQRRTDPRRRQSIGDAPV